MSQGTTRPSATAEHEVRDSNGTEVICTCGARFDRGSEWKSLMAASQHAMDESLAEADDEVQIDNPIDMQHVSALAARARRLGVSTRSLLPTAAEAIAVVVPAVGLGVGFVATIDGQVA